ncbi:MAG: hypothetical protein HUJ68_09790 [Clostridia bacterium]|nr:hypothetical protein [Clostridia bacterium]
MSKFAFENKKELDELFQKMAFAFHLAKIEKFYYRINEEDYEAILVSNSNKYSFNITKQKENLNFENVEGLFFDIDRCLKNIQVKSQFTRFLSSINECEINYEYFLNAVDSIKEDIDNLKTCVGSPLVKNPEDIYKYDMEKVKERVGVWCDAIGKELKQDYIDDFLSNLMKFYPDGINVYDDRFELVYAETHIDSFWLVRDTSSKATMLYIES